jgi:predicted transposase YbfD/YdcC
MVETSFFASSLDSKTTSAKIFADGIRGHWSIENSLHYIKDVTFDEDKSKIISANLAQSMSIIRNIAINLFRKKKYTNFKQTMRLLSGDIKKLHEMIS